MQLTVARATGLDGQTPLGALLGETSDISHYLDFGWYDLVWFKEKAGLDVSKLGSFLGITDSASNLMSYWVLPESEIPIIVGTVQPVTTLEKGTDANKARIKACNEKIAEKFKEKRIKFDGNKPQLDQWQELLEDDKDFAAEF